MRNYYFHPFATKIFPLVNISFFKGLLLSIKWCSYCILSHSYLHVCPHSKYRGHFCSVLSCFEIYILFWQVFPGLQREKSFRRATLCWLKKEESHSLDRVFSFHVSHVSLNVWPASEILFQFTVTLQLCLHCLLCALHCFSHKIFNFFLSVISKELLSKSGI